MARKSDLELAREQALIEKGINFLDTEEDDDPEMFDYLHRDGVLPPNAKVLFTKSYTTVYDGDGRFLGWLQGGRFTSLPF